MAKKRKAKGAPSGSADVKRSKNDESKFVINSYEDVEDSEDEFHRNRDKILLDESTAQRTQRRIQEEGLLDLRVAICLRRSVG